MRVAVVTRHLPGSDKVVSAVITASKHDDYDDVDNLLKYRAERHIRNFKEQFIEFEKAVWGIQYMDTIDIDS